MLVVFKKLCYFVIAPDILLCAPKCSLTFRPVATKFRWLRISCCVSSDVPNVDNRENANGYLTEINWTFCWFKGFETFCMCIKLSTLPESGHGIFTATLHIRPLPPLRAHPLNVKRLSPLTKDKFSPRFFDSFPCTEWILFMSNLWYFCDEHEIFTCKLVVVLNAHD